MPNLLENEYSLNVNTSKWYPMLLHKAVLVPNIFTNSKNLVYNETNSFWEGFSEQHAWLKQNLLLHVIRASESSEGLPQSALSFGTTLSIHLFVPRKKDLLHYKLRWGEFKPT